VHPAYLAVAVVLGFAGLVVEPILLVLDSGVELVGRWITRESR
jgi:hypothetical protein